MKIKCLLLGTLGLLSATAGAAKLYPQFNIEGNLWKVYKTVTFEGHKFCQIARMYDKEYQNYLIVVGKDRVSITGTAWLDAQHTNQALKIDDKLFYGGPSYDRTGERLPATMEFKGSREIVKLMMEQPSITVKLYLSAFVFGTYIGYVVKDFPIDGFNQIYSKYQECENSL